MSQILNNLQDVNAGITEVDSVAVRLFTNSISAKSTTIDIPLLESFLPLINDILVNKPEVDSELALFELMIAVLKLISFEDILQFYPKETIIQYLSSPNFHLRSLVLQIFHTKLHDRNAVQFLQQSDFIYIATKQHFTDDKLSDPSIAISTANAYETLIKSFPDDLYSSLTTSKLLSVYQIVRSSKSGLLIGRLLDFLLIVLPKVPDSIPSTVYCFPRQFFLPENDEDEDPLTAILVIMFYTGLVTLDINETIIKNIEKPLQDLIEIFSERENNFTVQSYYANQLVLLLSEWSYCGNPRLLMYLGALVKKFELFKSYNLFLLTSSNDILLVSKFNPEKFNNPELISDLKEMIPLYNKKFISILLNLISSENLFSELVSLNIISSAKIMSLAQDYLYTVLEQVTKFKYSTKWLLSSQQQLVSEYVIASPKGITDVAVWNSKRGTLENLMWRNNNDELEPWLQSIKETYALMINGRNVRDLSVQAVVADETA